MSREELLRSNSSEVKERIDKINFVESVVKVIDKSKKTFKIIIVNPFGFLFY
jgi:hypothetical protein